ncbi:MAG: pilus (MSHA type) biogenesis protein MshL [Acidiferrobacteraceae bacterium]
MRARNARLFTIFAFTAVAGCASTGWNTAVGRHINQTLANARKTAPQPVPESVSSSLMPGVNIRLPHGARTSVEPRFDLAVNHAPIRRVLLGLVQGTPYSVVVPAGVSGTVSLDLKHVTVPEAMRAIRRTYHYEYERRGHSYYVLPPGIETRIFRINYLNVTRTGTSNTAMSSGELTSVGTSSAGGALGAPTTSPATNNANNGALSSMRIETKSKSDFWKSLEQTVATVIGNKDGRTVVANPQAGLLIVRASPRELRMVGRLLRIMQANVNREVILDAKILEVQLNSGFQSGINWADLAKIDGATVTTGQVGGGTLLSGSGMSEIAGNTGNLNPSAYSAVNGTMTSAFGGIFSLAVQARNFTSFIELLKTQGRVQVLSSPRVATVNNQQAVIKVGGDDFFVTGVTNSVSSVGLTAVTTPAVQLTPFFSGIALDVTPEIDRHGAVILAIHPSVSQVVQKTQSFSVSGQAFTLPLASSSIQESDDVVRAHSGQIIVIGGLMKEGTTKDNASVPILGDIPVLGNLFKHRKVTRIKQELVILLKPTVVESQSQWARVVGDSQRRIREIRRGD